MLYRVMVTDAWESWTHPYYVELEGAREVVEFESYETAMQAARNLKGGRYVSTWVEPIRPMERAI